MASASKALRPSPSVSATQYPEGHGMLGNDGRTWKVQVTAAGIHRWVPSSHKFVLHDLVTIAAEGYGVPDAFIGNQFKVKSLGMSGNNPYYRLTDGNREITVYEGGLLAVTSAPAIVALSPVPKIKIMAKSIKSITKKTTAEVRTIETSLINKEEVFKMLALAESTGLPLLLVGDPGVAKTKTIIEYAKAWLNRDGKMSAEDFANKIYILETDESTKASEIKGINKKSCIFVL